jgi:plastocyanin
MRPDPLHARAICSSQIDPWRDPAPLEVADALQAAHVRVSAQDALVPRTVVIQRGGTVTFNTFGPHGVAIYEDGTEPGDIDTSVLAPPVASCPPVPLIDDPDRRIAVVAPQVCAGGTPTPAYTFTEPGRYLVICRFLPHFTEFDMYGWVIVRRRGSASARAVMSFG